MHRWMMLICAAGCALLISGDGRTEPVHHDARAALDTHPHAPPHAPDRAQMTASCPYQTWGWAASIIPLRGSANGTLIVNGTVRVPDGCYRASMIRGGLTPTQPPSQYFALDIDRAQDCIGSQSTRDLTVSAQLPAQPSYRSVVVLCRGSRFAEIERVSRVPAPQPETRR